MNLHPDLERWITLATRDLSEATAAGIRAEITAHYEDALDDYRQQGMSENAAHQQVMRDLGAAKPVLNGFKDVHRGMQTYGYALIACFLTFATLFIFPLLAEYLELEELETASLVLVTVFDITLSIWTVYILVVFGRLLSWRFNLSHAETLTKYVIGGLLLAISAEILNRWLFRDALYAAETERISTDEPLAGLLILLAIMGRLVLGVSLVMLGRVVYQVHEGFYGLGKPLAVFITSFGVCAGLAGIFVQLGSDTLGTTMMVGLMFSHLFIWTLMILLFFRLIYRSPIHPTRLA